MARYDVIVVGGGPAGMLAAAQAATAGARVLLLEKNDQVGKKMLITGGGRCNVTNQCEVSELIANIPGNGRFLYSALRQFSPQDLRGLLQKLGVATKVEDRGRVFPRSDKAADVVEALVKYLRQVGVTIRYQTSVEGVLSEEGHCRGVQIGDEVIPAQAVVIATGGLSYTRTGSNGDGYRMAKKVGHQVTKLYPAAVSITSDEPWILEREVQGLALSDVRLAIYNLQGKVLASERGDIIFAHWGLSGPGTLRVGRTVALEKQKNQAELQGRVDLFPDQTPEELEQRLLGDLPPGSKRSAKNLLTPLVPERLAKLLLLLAEIPAEKPQAQVSKGSWQRLLGLLKALPLRITGTRPLEEATVTAGGVHLKEINPKTMESKLMKGLFFAGEVLDVDAHTGGFNMQVAFSTGYVAGEGAAAHVQGNQVNLDE